MSAYLVTFIGGIVVGVVLTLFSLYVAKFVEQGDDV